MLLIAVEKIIKDAAVFTLENNKTDEISTIIRNRFHSYLIM